MALSLTQLETQDQGADATQYTYSKSNSRMSLPPTAQRPGEDKEKKIDIL